MLRLTEVKLPLAHAEGEIRAAILKRLNITADELVSYVVFKRGVDARNPNAILYTYTLDIEVRDEAAVLERFSNDQPLRKDSVNSTSTGGRATRQLPQSAGSAITSDLASEVGSPSRMARSSASNVSLPPHVRITPDTSYHFVAQAPENLTSRPVVIGMGPAGLFAGLLLAQMGFRPLILERGKAVRERTKDTFGLWRQGVLNPESNVQFGEGGAGTFSDGKLYSQIKDPRYLGRKVLDEFVKAGAPEEILYVSHPHIGTFRLVGMVEKDARNDPVPGRRGPFRKPRR